MLDIVFVFGTAKLAYKILESIYHKTIAIVMSTQNYPQTKPYILNYEEDDEEYDSQPHKIISDSDYIDGSLSFIEDGINVYIMNLFAHKEIFELLNTFFAISCCRNGLNETYIPLLNSLNCNGTIVSFDNNKDYAHAANKASVNCNVYAGVAHCHVPFSLKWNEKETIATIEATKFGYLYFPPHCEVFRRFFKPSPMSPVSIVYTNTDKELVDAIHEKLCNVNVIHTLFCCEVKILYPNHYETMRFGDLSMNEFNNITNKILKTHKMMYTYWFGNRGNVEEASKIALAFIENLYKYNEPFSRGIDFLSQRSIEKVKEHFLFMEEAGVNTDLYRSIIEKNM